MQTLQMRSSPSSAFRGTRPSTSVQHARIQRVAKRDSIKTQATMKALIFDCDGVILESEDLHRLAYNAAFQHFNVKIGARPVTWSEEFYDMLQNKVGGGKPKMRWFFGENGWPSSSLLGKVADTDEERVRLVDELQDFKTQAYKDLIGSGQVETRPGVLRLMDEAREAGLKVAVCSAATKSSVVYTLSNLLGKARFEGLDCFMAGDDAPRLKPDPCIYQIAAERLGVQPSECVVVEDSIVGLKAATGAGMRCIITYTRSTRDQEFTGAWAVVSDLGEWGMRAVRVNNLLAGHLPITDDRAISVA